MALGFSLIKDPDFTEYRVVRTSGAQAYTIGDLVQEYVTGGVYDVTIATAATTTILAYGVAMETIVATATSLLICLITPRQDWTADVTNAPSTSHNMQRMILTDKATVNNTGTTDATSAAIFQQRGVVSVTGKRIVGRFLSVSNVTV